MEAAPLWAEMFATYFASVKKVRLPRCWIVNGWPSLALAVFQESKTGHFCLQRSVDRLRSRLFGCTLRLEALKVFSSPEELSRRLREAQYVIDRVTLEVIIWLPG